MTEEEPVVRRRRINSKIYQVIFVIVGLQSLYVTFASHTKTLNEWPADLADHASYCKPESYKTCREGDWFGILKSRLSQPGLLKDICESWADTPDDTKVRMIEASDGDTLDLCRMKDPTKIDAAKMPH
jgi:hypothetical protein